jgi:hypothetical protein
LWHIVAGLPGLYRRSWWLGTSSQVLNNLLKFTRWEAN